jgi:hypothetical protein
LADFSAMPAGRQSREEAGDDRRALLGRHWPMLP